MATLRQIRLNQDFEKLPLKKLFIASFIVSSFTIVLGLFAQIFLPPEIPLYYGLPQTSAQITKSLLIILPSLISFFITTINAFISIKIHDNYLKKTLAFASIATSLLAMITTYKILFLVSTI